MWAFSPDSANSFIQVSGDDPTQVLKGYYVALNFLLCGFYQPWSRPTFRKYHTSYSYFDDANTCYKVKYVGSQPAHVVSEMSRIQ